MWNDAPVAAITEPIGETRIDDLVEHRREGDGVGVLELVKRVRQLGVFGRPVCIDDRPERGCLRWWRLRIEVREVDVLQIGGYVREASGLIPCV